MKIKTLLFGAIVALSATFNASAMDDGCNQVAREPNSNIKKYNLQTTSDHNYQLDIWRLQCDDSMQILVKIYPKSGKTRAVTSSLYDKMYIYQGGKQVSYWDMWDGERLVTSDEPLFVQGIWGYSDTKFDFEMKQTVEAKVSNAGSSLLSGTTTIDNTSNTVSGITGTWYDPAYDGSGFNVVETSSGLFLYFYGYKAAVDGQALWLVSSVGPKTLTKGQSFSMTLYTPMVGNGANFITKPTNGSGVSEWGTATLTFNSCTSGTITLNGQDGTLTHNVVKLANINNLTCSE